MGWTEDIEARLASLEASAQQAQATLEQTRNAVLQTSEQLDSLRTDVFNFNEVSLGKLSEVGDYVESDLPILFDESTHRIEDRVGEMATRLDDVKFHFKSIADSGNVWAQSLIALIGQVEDGVLSAGDVIHAFGDAKTEFEGHTRSIRDLLNDVLPRAGEVQNRIRDTLERLKADGLEISEVIEELSKQTATSAHELAELLRALQDGKVTIQTVMDSLARVKLALPGSETSQLAGALEDSLRRRGLAG